MELRNGLFVVKAKKKITGQPSHSLINPVRSQLESRRVGQSGELINYQKNKALSEE
jgi:hypothetical protein